jgi:hypothetical protein
MAAGCFLNLYRLTFYSLKISLQSLIQLLSHSSDDVARSAAEAIAIMSVDIEVKKAALSQNCSDPLQLLLLRSPSVQLAACQVTNLVHFFGVSVSIDRELCCCG